VTKPLLSITTSRSNSETVVKLSGECDISNVKDLNKAVYDILISENQRIVLDVEELNFMGSCGLTPIERAVEALQPVGGIVVVKRPSRMLHWLLETFGVASKAVVIK
jgi:anti-anti-sigma factor